MKIGVDRPVLRRLRSSAIAAPTESSQRGLGHLAPIALAAALGLLVCSTANALSRAMLDPSQLIFWAGVLIIALPVFYRLTSADASPTERFALVCLLAAALYGVKVVGDAPLYTFPDEPIHAFNAEQIVEHGELFRSNPILAATPQFPGLEGATSALMTLTGMSSFGAGVIVVGMARLCLVAAMFLLFLRLSGSARVAGLGTALYTGSFNFLYWGAQFSYESLSLPLMLLVMMALAEREAAPRARWRAWALPVLLGTAAIVVTHHLTSYALTIFLASLALCGWAIRRSWRPPNPWPFAVFAGALALIWLVVVASNIVDYITPVLGDAVSAIVDTVGGEAEPRALFEKETPEADATPTVARGLALLAVVILAAGLPFGLRRAWASSRTQPLVILLMLAALGFFGTLALRFAPDAWETGNRASGFLFIGLAFIVAGVGLDRWRPREMPRLGRMLATACLAVVMTGGIISGWPWGLRLASPLRVSAEGQTINSPPLALAEWAGERVPDERFAATAADARLLMSAGDRWALPGPSPAIDRIIEQPRFFGWEAEVLREYEIRYVVTDRRDVGEDSVRGLWFGRKDSEGERLPKAAVTKFSQLPGASRIYTNGEIAVYELEERR
jgi:hypothetical protein